MKIENADYSDDYTYSEINNKFNNEDNENFKNDVNNNKYGNVVKRRSPPFGIKPLLSIRNILIIAILLLAAAMVLDYFLLKNKAYDAEHFGIETIKSTIDFNGDGIDDYTAFVLGARYYIETKPKYDGRYWDSAYPPDDIGVCTDVIWQAFKYAGYNLKEMVDKDVAENLESYPRVGGKPDPNIDFRRVPNLKVFFEKYAVNMTLDTKDISQWQPGDIITYKNRDHIAIVSDKRNRYGVPFIIHNGGNAAEENSLLLRSAEITGHFRFDAELILDEALIAW